MGQCLALTTKNEKQHIIWINFSNMLLNLVDIHWYREILVHTLCHSYDSSLHLCHMQFVYTDLV